MPSAPTELGPVRRTLAALGLGALLTIATACADPVPVPVAETAPDSTLVLESITRPAEGGDVHFVRLVQNGDRYAFEPDSIALPPGDVVRFVMVDAQPESVAFRPDSASPDAASFIRAHSLQRGVVLTDPGQTYDVSLTGAPAGRYPFESIPHGDRGMRGVVIVIAE